MKPVVLPAHAFVFCRYTIAVLVWLAWLFRSPAWLIAATLLLALSALLKVARAPLIVLYSQTALRFYRCPDEVVEERAMRFAHILGTLLGLAALAAVWINARVGWRVVLLFALLKSVSALGFCPAGKLFTCATNTTCCPVTKKFLGVCRPNDPSQDPR